MGATNLDLSQIKTDVLSAASTFRTLIGLGNVDNTSDANKPISTATQTALDLKANSSSLANYLPLAGGTLTGGLGGTDISLSGGVNLVADVGWVGISNASTRFLPRASSFRLYANTSLTIESNTNDTAINTTLTTRQLYLRNSTNAMRMELYGTYTDASNYRRFYISSTTSGAFTLGAEGLGTGASGNTLAIANALSISGNVTADSFISSSLTITGGSPSNIVSSNRITFTSSAAYIFYKSGNSFTLDPSGSNAATFGGDVVATNNLLAGSSSSIGFTSRSVVTSPQDNIIQLSNAAQNDFGTLRLGGSTSSFPAIKRNAANIDFRTADDGNFCDIRAKVITSNVGSNTNGLNIITSGYVADSYVDQTFQSSFVSGWTLGRIRSIARPSYGGALAFHYQPGTSPSSPTVEGMRLTETGLLQSGPIQASTVVSTNKGLIVRGSAAQSANLVEVQDSSQTVLASIDKDGDIVANSGSFHTVQLTSSLPRQSGVLFLDNGILNASPNFIHDHSNLASPKLVFKASGNATPDISLNVLTSASGSSSGVQTLSFEGSAGQLFSVSDVLNSGTIFGVNDISGLPLLEVDATGLVSLARFGTGINAHRTVNCLQGVSGTYGLFGGTVTVPTLTGSSNLIYVSQNQTLSWDFDTSNSNPALRFTWGGAATTLWGSSSAVNISVQGTNTFRVTSGTTNLSGSLGLGSVSSPNLFLRSDSSNALDIRNGANGQVFRLYNAYTDGSNYDRGFMRWNSNILEIGTERAGTYATTRSLSFVFQGVTRGGLSPTGGFWVGDANAATDQSAVICGMYGTASIPHSAIVGGMRGNTYLYGQTVVAFGGRPFNSANISGGPCQSWLLTLSGYTTDATQTRMRAGDTSATWDWYQRLTVRSGYTVSYLACIKGIKSDGTARARFWRLIDITRIGNTTALDVAAETLGTDHNPSSCTITIQADDTNEAMEILVGGVAGETWRWTGTLYATEMQYGT